MGNLRWCSQSQNIRYAYESGALKVATKKVAQYDLNDNFIRTFDSIKEATKAVNLKGVSSISNVLSGKRKTARGFKWKYV